MLQVLAVYYSAKNWFPAESIPAAGLAKSLPFIVIVIAMFVRGKSLPERGTIGGGRLPVRAVAPPRADPRRAGRPRPRSSGCSASASTGARPSSTPSSSP